MKQLIFSVTNVGTVIFHKQSGWAVPISPSDIYVEEGTVIVISRGNEFSSLGMFIKVNTNANYSWTNAGELRITALFGISGAMSVKIECEF